MQKHKIRQKGVKGNHVDFKIFNSPLTMRANQYICIDIKRRQPRLHFKGMAAGTAKMPMFL